MSVGCWHVRIRRPYRCRRCGATVIALPRDWTLQAAAARLVGLPPEPKPPSVA